MTEHRTRRSVLALGAGLAGAICAPSLLHAEPLERPETQVRDLEPDGAPHGYRLFIERIEGEGPLSALYLLDGNRTFPLARDAALDRGRALLLVGLGYPVEERDEIVRRRFIDFTPPTPADEVLARGNEEPRETGGRDVFAGVLAASVGIAERDHDVQASRRTLFGHSLGGHFALHCLFSHSPLFGRILAADPSVWWGDHGLMRELEAFRAAGGSERPRRLAVVTAGRWSDRRRGDLDARRSGPGGAEVAEALEGDPALSVTHEVYADETHGSMLPRAVRASVELALS